jgi:hypothetical protein
LLIYLLLLSHLVELPCVTACWVLSSHLESTLTGIHITGLARSRQAC